MEVVSGFLRDLSLQGKRISYESDTYYFSPKALTCLQQGEASASWVDADLLVNWCRAIKSDAEIEVMRQAARLVEGAMTVAYENIAPGVRQCDLAAKATAAQISGNEQFGGDSTALSPLILAGKAATTAHPMWTDEPFENNQTVALQLGGTRKRYNAGLARTIQLGKGPQAVFDTAEAVQEGLSAVLETIKPGVLTLRVINSPTSWIAPISACRNNACRRLNSATLSPPTSGLPTLPRKSEIGFR